MMGLGSTCKLTPVYSTRILLHFNGAFNNTSSGVQDTISLRWGTGTAPANAAALSGTVLISLPYLTAAASPASGFSQEAIITGLSAGTAYWFDLGLAAGSGTAALSSITCTAMEF